MSKWISIAHREPKDQEMIVYTDGILLPIVGRYVSTGKDPKTSEIYLAGCEIVWWMPLPERPDLKKKKHHCANTIIKTGIMHHCDQIGSQLCVYTYTEMGRKEYFEVSFCPFCGEKAEEGEDCLTDGYGPHKQ